MCLKKDSLKLETDHAGVVCCFSDQKLACDLLSLGVTPGSHIRLVKKSPFGASFLVEVEGRKIAIGPQEMRAINLRS